MSLQVLGVGFHKTGTTSLGDALEILGYSRKSFAPDASMQYRRGYIDAVVSTFEDYDAFEDWPWPLLYREAHEHHPDLKMILTLREDFDTWFDSLVRHRKRLLDKDGKSGKFEFRSALYGFDDPEEDKDHVIAVHRKHIEDVRAFAAAKKIPFLEMIFERGDGWNKLCSFLGKPVPDRHFPHSNKNKAIPAGS